MCLLSVLRNKESNVMREENGRRKEGVKSGLVEEERNQGSQIKWMSLSIFDE